MKTYLVTGATRGIGRAIAEKLLKDESVKVVTIHRNESSDSLSLAASYGDRVELHRFDMTDRAALASFCSDMAGRAFEGIVNNAGELHFTQWDDFSYEDWDRTFAINLTAPLMIMQKLGQNVRMGGCIVNISSTDANVAAFSTIPYASSKAALLSVTKSAGALLGQRGVRVNAVVPGWVLTAMADDMPAEANDITPLGRAANPGEIADVVEFLLSDKAAYINATSITVDGGYSTIDTTILGEHKTIQAK
jgi:NAD(P)-dependent dehydrogenase (short-subunit alcohol dehydrogenase family)